MAKTQQNSMERSKRAEGKKERKKEWELRNETEKGLIWQE